VATVNGYLVRQINGSAIATLSTARSRGEAELSHMPRPKAVKAAVTAKATP
jgi:hypothetical protein